MVGIFNRVCIVITGAVVFFAALLTATPGLSWLDAGDFVTAASTLGVPHATGFPVYILLGHLATYIPFGSHAFRVAILSALFSGVAAACIIAVVANQTRNVSEVITSAIALILVFIGAPTLFLHSRIPEVYMLNCALASGCLLCLERYFATDDTRWCYGLAVIGGLGLTTHALFRLWIPIFFVALFLKQENRKVRIVVPWLLLLGLGLLAFFYLAASALSQPAHNWGDPSSPGRLWAHINALEIRRTFQKDMTPSLFSIKIHLIVYVSQLWSALGPLLPLGLLGFILCLLKMLYTGLKSNTVKLGLLLGCIVGAESVYAVGINPMGLKDLQNGQLSIVLLAVTGALFLSKLLNGLAGKTPRLSRLSAVSSLVILPIGLVPFMKHDFYGIYRDWSVEDLAVIHTSFAEPDSMTTLVSDSLIAAHLYVNIVLDARPDMAIFGRNQLGNGRRFAYTARKQPFSLLDEKILSTWENLPTGVSEAEFAKRAETIVERHLTKRTVYWESSISNTDLPNSLTVFPGWPVGRVSRANETDQLNRCNPQERSYCNAALDISFAKQARALSGSKDKYYGYWSACNWGNEGKWLFEQRNYRAALEMFLKAADLAPDRVAWKTNIAVCLASMGQIKQALTVIEQVIATDPLSKTAVKNGILYARSLGDKATLAHLEAHARLLE